MISGLRSLVLLCTCSFVLAACASSSAAPNLGKPEYINAGTASVNVFRWTTSPDGSIKGSEHTYTDFGGQVNDEGTIPFTGVQHGKQLTFDFHPSTGVPGSLTGTIGPKGLTVHFPVMAGCKPDTTDLFVKGYAATARADMAKMNGESECSP